MSYDALEEMSAFFSRRCSIYDTVHPATIDGGPESKQDVYKRQPPGFRYTVLILITIGAGKMRK